MKKSKALRTFTIIAVLIIQIAFLLFIAKSHYDLNNNISIIILIGIIMLVLLGHYVLDLHEKDLELDKLSVVVWVPFGAMCCYLLNSKTGLGSVISAGAIGTLASFLPNINKRSNYFKKIPPAIYCGVFVGMSSTVVSPSIAYVVTASIIAGLFLLLSKNLFTGFGGKLGTMAFMGVFIVYLIKLVS